MNETIPFLPGLSPLAGKELFARFDGSMPRRKRSSRMEWPTSITGDSLRTASDEIWIMARRGLVP